MLTKKSQCSFFKFLDPTGCTYHNDKPFVYNLPGPGEKWARTDHPDPAEPDGEACGPGRLHLMRRLDARYAPQTWWPWWARGIGEIGGDSIKAAFASVELRRISPRVLHRALRPPFNWGCKADLRWANLHRANLYGANLRRANLRWANLHRANLSGADLRWANLHRANLRWANLHRANLYGADLSEANLYGANLSGADLRWANLHRANLYGANLSGANLRGADLHRAYWNEYTQWPSGFTPPVSP